MQTNSSFFFKLAKKKNIQIFKNHLKLKHFVRKMKNVYTQETKLLTVSSYFVFKFDI